MQKSVVDVAHRTLATLIKRPEGQIAIHSVSEHGSEQNAIFSSIRITRFNNYSILSFCGRIIW
jgi:hypothetical protein